METLEYRRFDSAVGALWIGLSSRGLRLLEFDRDRRSFTTKNYEAERQAVEEKAGPYIRQLEEYFRGKRRTFDFPLDLCGTPFQTRCWQALLAIPYGETRTYADIARVVRSPHGFRAVGMANNRNPIAIVVPCHRVIASDGTLGGYGAGVEIKRKLLELERSVLAGQAIDINM